MNKYVKADPILCIGCRTCMIACVVNHTGKRIFTIDPNGYDFNPRIHIIKTKDTTKPVQCHHCPKPRCMTACPAGAISLGPDSVILNEELCKGCGSCVAACPFGAITLAKIYHENRNRKADVSVAINGGIDKKRPSEMHDPGKPIRIVAYKCDLCVNTETGQPACIPACPTEALTLFDPASAVIKRAKIQKAKSQESSLNGKSNNTRSTTKMG